MHAIHGIVAKQAATAGIELRQGGVADLAQGFCLAILSSGFADAPNEEDYFESNAEGLPVTFEDFDYDENMRELFSLAELMSSQSLVAVVATAYFGGPGYQLGALWQHGICLEQPEWVRAGAINDVLKQMGVTCEGDLDEYDSVGIGWHRSNEEWIAFALGDKIASIDC